MGCMKFEHLLRDRQFTIRTDHRNLTFMAKNANPMIERWKVRIQELDFQVEHIPGKDNIVADAFSRLVPNNMVHDKRYSKEDITLASLFEETDTEDIICPLAPQQGPALDTIVTNRQFLTISKVHNSIAGHHGVERTISRLLQMEETWKYQRQHVKDFISKCPCCQKMSQIKPVIIAHPFSTTSYIPMDKLNIDFISPFPDGGYILVVIELYSLD